MTAKTRHGHGAHRPAHGADPGSTHERLNRRHAMPGRPEGAMHAGGEMPAQPAPEPMGGVPAAGGMPGGQSMGAGPSTDGDEGEQS